MLLSEMFYFKIKGEILIHLYNYFTMWDDKCLMCFDVNKLF